ncbi:prolipoprotein diacylglyceryl transferase [Curtobacterium sp. ISL-83]|uniref:prolipoprotein diacylglyceryl transferase n=1 Tax=Curtobacterium sp. ISL-83 TaxID=2819145 RepID=UPI001BE77132|nr:prolipoprotein diacylglyceryl transferase [Curtobacterium sp. ISL-83]MBT2504170.1 prolipoprotein diacylglyceryl transferase [Curtobacterium sp. ISL-83]
MVVAAGIPSPPTNGFAIGPLEVHYYALCILGGIVIASWVTASRLRTGGISGGSVIDVAIWGVPIALVGGRLYHVFTHPDDYFFPGANLSNVFAIWEGGLAIYGSILAGIFGVWIGCRRTHVPFVTLVDALAPGMLFAQAFGRLGNYFNQELFGNPTTLPWGLQIHTSSPAFPPGLPAGTLFQPLFLYELLWDAAGGTLILLLGKRFRLPRGVPIGMYFLWYGAGRAYLETLRLDPTELVLGGLKFNTLAAILAALTGLTIVIVVTVPWRRRLEATNRVEVSGQHLAASVEHDADHLT